MLSLRQDDLLINKQIQNLIIVYFEWNQEFLTKKTDNYNKFIL